ncbi:MAG: NAD(P)H-dependent flavin oxidoreductase [Hyphomicrobiales bacterium]
MNKITELFGIEYPLIQAGMVWCSGWKLAAAVSNAGGLGLIGSSSMRPDVLQEHIQKCKAATNKPFGVNITLQYPEIDKITDIIIEEGVKIVFSSAGNPKLYTPKLKEHGVTVVHVIANTKFAKKCEEAGVDAIVAEGFEAGGHNGLEETTTMALIPLIKKATNLPLIAAGGIGSGRAMLAAMALGADGVQVGTRFAMTNESSAHEAFKNRLTELVEGDTKLLLKKIGPIRMVKNKLFEQIAEAENRGAEVEELKAIKGRGKSKIGMFEGDIINGELEIGQIAAAIDTIEPAAKVVNDIINEFFIAQKELANLSFSTR